MTCIPSPPCSSDPCTSCSPAPQVSLLGVVLGLLSAWLVSAGTRGRALLGAAHSNPLPPSFLQHHPTYHPGVLAYKARDLADSLDGVVARGARARVVPTPGSKVMVVAGKMDVAVMMEARSGIFWILGSPVLKSIQKVTCHSDRNP